MTLQGDFVVETTLVGVVMNGLSHLHKIRDRAHFAVCLMRGLGGNLPDSLREKFAQEVFSLCGESPPDGRRVLDTFYDTEYHRLSVYQAHAQDELIIDSLTGQNLPVIQTVDVQRDIDMFDAWLQPENKQPFILVGPDGCGKG